MTGSILVDKEFVESFKEIFGAAYELYCKNFQPETITENGEEKEYIRVDQNQECNFWNHFLSHLNKLPEKYQTYYVKNPQFQVNLPFDFLIAQLDADIKAMNLHREFLVQASLQKKRLGEDTQNP